MPKPKKPSTLEKSGQIHTTLELWDAIVKSPDELKTLLLDPAGPEFHRLIVKAFAAGGYLVAEVISQHNQDLWIVRIDGPVDSSSIKTPLKHRPLGTLLRRHGIDFVPKELCIHEEQEKPVIAFIWHVGGPDARLIVRSGGRERFRLLTRS